MKHKNYLLIISFIIIIFIVPLMGMIGPDHEFSTIESRNLQKFPVLGEDGIENFTNSFENYLVDQFPKRDILLDVYTKLQLISNKIKIRNTIVLDNWLFVRDYKIDENNLNDLIDSLRKAVNENKDLDFHYVVLPSKTGMLADLYPKYIDGNISRNNNEKLKRSLGDIQRLNTVNVFHILADKYTLEERKNFYYQTDFHWNERGSYKAFEVMISNIIDYDTFKAAEERLEKVQYKNKYFKGDLERRFSENIVNTETPSSYEVSDTRDLVYYTSIDDQELVDRKEIIAKNVIQDEINYNDIFTYNLSCIRIINKNPIVEKKVLILKDSFFNAMVDPITTIFSELIIIDPRYYNEDYTFREIIKEKNPDCVLLFYHQSNVDKDLIKFLRD